MDKLERFWARIKPALFHVKSAGILTLGLLLLAVLEVYSAWYAFAAAPAKDLWPTPWGEYPRAALLHSALSVICGVFAFVGMAAAGGLKDDARKRYSSRAWVARVVAIGFLAVPGGPVANLAGAFSLDRQVKQFEVYKTSPAYEEDVRALREGILDPFEREAVKRRVTPPSTGEVGVLDWLTAVFLHALVMWSAAAFRLAPPITQAELDAIARAEAEAALLAKRQAAAAKGVATRKANAAAKAKAKAPKNVTPLFGMGKA